MTDVLTKAPRLDSRPCIRPVGGPEEWRMVQRLRYESFVEELGYAPDGADHTQRLLGDAVDATATTLVSVVDGKVIASIRLELDGLTESGYGQLLDVQSWVERQGPNAPYLVSKLVVAPAHRGTRVTVAMMSAAYVVGLRAGRTHALIASKPELQPFYERFGFRPYGGLATTLQFGVAQRLSLDLWDLPHLESVRSPFAALLRSHLQQFGSVSVAS